MTERRGILMGLVLVNLVFVHITEAARWTWVGPLFALTIGTPWLVRFREARWYRWGWNSLVVLVFGVLVHHTVTAGVRNVLEDGLRLAAVCQVHLLNNLGRDQKADLLYFNSFLIAVVTSFLCLDLAYCAVFLVYVPLLLLGLQERVLGEWGGPSVFPRGHGAAYVLGRSVLVLGLAFTLFVAWPRDFDRKGFLARSFRSQGSDRSKIDFSESISLGNVGLAKDSRALVMTVRLLAGSASAVPLHWRGGTLDQFDGRQWHGRTKAWSAGPGRWRTQRPGSWRRGSGTVETRVLVDQTAVRSGRLFVPLSALELEETAGVSGRTHPYADMTFRYRRVPHDRDGVTYELGFAPAVNRGVAEGRGSPPYVFLGTPNPPTAATEKVVQELREIGRTGSREEIAKEVDRLLSTRYRYRSPTELGLAQSLDHFLEGSAPGHCQYFATASCLLLRHLGVPARVVTGYRSNEWDEDRTVLTVRERHAHAWTEYLDEASSWIVLDASPLAADAAGEGAWYERIGRWITETWSRITDFDNIARARWVASLVALPKKAWSFVGSHPMSMGFGVFLIGCGVWIRRSRRRARVPAAARQLLGEIAALGLELGPSETPRELFARAQAELVDTKALHRLWSALEEHEAERFAGKPRRRLATPA